MSHALWCLGSELYVCCSHMSTLPALQSVCVLPSLGDSQNRIALGWHVMCRWPCLHAFMCDREYKTACFCSCSGIPMCVFCACMAVCRVYSCSGLCVCALMRTCVYGCLNIFSRYDSVKPVDAMPHTHI